MLAWRTATSKAVASTGRPPLSRRLILSWSVPLDVQAQWETDTFPTQVTSLRSRTLATPYEGQLKLLALLRPHLALDLITVEALLRHTLQAEGDLFAFQVEQDLNDGPLRAIIEYADTGSALEAIAKYRHGLDVDVSKRIVKYHLAESEHG